MTSPSDALVIFGLFFICAAAGAYLAAGRRSYK